MIDTTNILTWLQEWYSSQCDDDWEHEYGVKIYTLDNPGWTVEIDLTGTLLEGIEIQRILCENRDDDWYAYRIKDNVYIAEGDAKKLEILLTKFKEIVDQYSNDTKNGDDK